MPDFIATNKEIIALIEALDLQLLHIYNENSVEIPQNQWGKPHLYNLKNPKSAIHLHNNGPNSNEPGVVLWATQILLWG